MTQLKRPEMTDQQKHDANIQQWNRFRFNNVLIALECEQKRGICTCSK